MKLIDEAWKVWKNGDVLWDIVAGGSLLLEILPYASFESELGQRDSGKHLGK